MLSICGSCKAMRDEDGRWRKLETDVTEHSKARFTHGLCLECPQKHHSACLDGGGPPPRGEC